MDAWGEDLDGGSLPMAVILTVVEPTLLWLHAAVSALVVMRNESRVKLGALATPYARSAVRWQTALAKKMETGSRRSMAQRAWPGWLGPSAALQQMKKLTSSPHNDESCEQASEKAGRQQSHNR